MFPSYTPNECGPDIPLEDLEKGSPNPRVQHQGSRVESHEAYGFSLGTQTHRDMKGLDIPRPKPLEAHETLSLEKS